MPDGCTGWFDGWPWASWRHCCDIHDGAYLDGTVSLQSHYELGVCVVQAGGGVVMGTMMALATTWWWWIRHRGRRPRS
jgi:hypothetical protein